MPPLNRRGTSLENSQDEAALSNAPIAPATVLEGNSALLNHSPRQHSGNMGWQTNGMDFGGGSNSMADRFRLNQRFRSSSFDSDREGGNTFIDHRPSQASAPIGLDAAPASARSPRGLFHRSSYSPLEPLPGHSPSTARSMAYHSARSPNTGVTGSVEPGGLSPGLSRHPSEANAEDDVCFPQSPPGLLDHDINPDTHAGEHAVGDSTVSRTPMALGGTQELPPGYPYTFDLDSLDEFARNQKEQQSDSIPIAGRVVTHQNPTSRTLGNDASSGAAASAVSKSGYGISYGAPNDSSFYTRRPRKYTPQEEEAVAAHVAPRYSGQAHQQLSTSQVDSSNAAGRYQRKLALFEDQVGAAPHPPPPTGEWDENDLEPVPNADGSTAEQKASGIQATAHTALLESRAGRARQTYGMREDEALPEAPSSPPPSGPAAFLRRKSGNRNAQARGGQTRMGAEVRYNVAGEKHKPFRFAFYSNALNSTIHARHLYELPAPGQTFEDLLKGRSPSATPNHDDDPAVGQHENDADTLGGSAKHGSIGTNPALTSRSSEPRGDAAHRINETGKSTPTAVAQPGSRAPSAGPHPSQSGGAGAATARPSPMGKLGKTLPGGQILTGGTPGEESNTWWLDIQSPTVDEMKVISRAFGIHPLTTEDILMEETREKIELFRSYYLVCFRSFDQDPYSPTYLQPLNMYIIVFREGTLSFHFRSTPHPHNVRRRIKQLKDYIQVTSDWISYALIDDITDAFGPLIQSIEYEVDSIDELVLILKEAEQSDMLRRIGTCRKKVMGLLRLMGSKADVVKGLAKRCNENWSVAPKSDIGLYLSDIQDHLITMTQNLNHYEKILSRSHSNYLAQISIEMTDANNQINDVLSKLTALGTVIVPLNILTSLWGVNVKVPGQVDDHDNLNWFFGLVGAMIFIGVGGFIITLRYLKR